MNSHDFASRSPDTTRSTAFDLLDRRIQKWAWQRKWTDLHSIQEKAFRAIIDDPECDVVIAAPTAGGKTEAAFLPILTVLAASREERIGFRVLYVSPLRALIDDQYDRLSEIGTLVDVDVTPWHSDVSRSTKARALRKPSGVLLTTPESLEAFFVLRGQEMKRLFAPLMFVVIDELHSFMPSERGRQLQSLMHRLDLVTGKSVRRVALSATLGDLNQASSFLRPRGARPAMLIRSDDTSELRMALLAFVADSPDIPTQATQTEERTQELARAREIPEMLFNTLRGTNTLIFVNTRQGVELYADKLRRLSERAAVPNEFFPHHGSLSMALRKHAESMLRNPNRPATAICTSTLELGIDIGHVNSVVQIECPPSVSSIRQRLGRSGRRGDPAVLRLYVTEHLPAPDSNIEEWLHLKLIQTIAQTDLLLAGWCESPTTESLHLSTLLHQILSLIGEKGGVSSLEAWSILCQTGPFANVHKSVFISLLRQMGNRELIEQAPDGSLLLGLEGERLQSRRDFYAVFHTPAEYTLLAPNGPLGSLPISYPLTPGHYMIFGGRRWLIQTVDTLRRVVTLVPSPVGKPPRFAGSGWLVGDEVRKRMHEVLRGTMEPVYIDKTAAQLFRDASTAFEEAGLSKTSLVQRNGDSFLFCWRSDAIRYTLKGLLACVGCTVDALAVALRCPRTPLDVFELKLHEAGDIVCDPEELAAHVKNRESAKFDEYLGNNLVVCDYASRMIRIEDTQSFVKEILREC